MCIKEEWIKRCISFMVVFFFAIGVYVEFSSNATIFAREEMKSGNYAHMTEGNISQETEYDNIIVTSDAGAGDVSVFDMRVSDDFVTNGDVTDGDVTEVTETEATETKVTEAETTEIETTEQKLVKQVNYAPILSELQASATKSVKESDWSAISFVEELENGTRIYSFEGDEYIVPANLSSRAAMVSTNGYIEKITQVPHYVQQSYPYTAYGNYGTISSHGCGITSCAMVYSYLLDYEIRPDELAKKYGRYNTYNGSLYSLFTDSAKDFDLEVKMTYSWNEVVDGLERGCVVIANVKDDTIFTTGGHYIVYYGISEDGKILINDSNLYNYGDWRTEALANGFKNGFDQRYCNYSFPCFIYEPKDIEKIAENNQNNA